MNQLITEQDTVEATSQVHSSATSTVVSISSLDISTTTEVPPLQTTRHQISLDQSSSKTVQYSTTITTTETSRATDQSIDELGQTTKVILKENEMINQNDVFILTSVLREITILVFLHLY